MELLSRVDEVLAAVRHMDSHSGRPQVRGGLPSQKYKQTENVRTVSRNTLKKTQGQLCAILHCKWLVQCSAVGATPGSARRACQSFGLEVNARMRRMKSWSPARVMLTSC
jgi:hypothetical protein